MAEGKRLHKAQACETLRAMIKPGDTVYTTLRSVSRSGMRRTISIHVVDDGQIRDVSNLAAIATDSRIANDGGLIVGGCGMDMGFHIVYSLGWAIYPQGSNCGRQGKPDTDGGYSLNQRWI